MPIGIFDSGVGGLTVVKAVRAAYPKADIVYLGDSARVPYGTKSPATVSNYSHACLNFLLSKNIDLAMIACNTATAFGLKSLQATSPVPVIGAIRPGAISAAITTRTGKVGVIGTNGTIRSGAYAEAIAQVDSTIQVYSTACPLFVPLAEEGWTDGEVPLLAAKRYLEPLLENEIDTLVLGCTHYPLLSQTILEASKQLGCELSLCDSATAMATAAGEFSPADGEGKLDLYVTDDSGIDAMVKRFLGEECKATLVDIHTTSKP